MMNDHDQRTPTHHPETASRTFTEEAVIISPSRNVVRMLNPVGTRIWELADGTRTIDQIAEVLTDEFDVDLAQARHSVATFVTELVDKELLIWT